MRTEINYKYYLGDGEHYLKVRADKYSGAPLVELFKVGESERLTCWNLSFDDLDKHNKTIEKAEVWVMQSQKSK